MEHAQHDQARSARQVVIGVGPLNMNVHMVRLAAFREKHPEWNVYLGEFGTWQAERDTDHGSDTHVRYRLGDLLDFLEGEP